MFCKCFILHVTTVLRRYSTRVSRFSWIIVQTSFLFSLSSFCFYFIVFGSADRQLFTNSVLIYLTWLFDVLLISDSVNVSQSSYAIYLIPVLSRMVGMRTVILLSTSVYGCTIRNPCILHVFLCCISAIFSMIQKLTFLYLWNNSKTSCQMSINFDFWYKELQFNLHY